MSKEDNNWGYFPEKNPIELWENTPLFDENIDQHTPTITPYIIDDDKSRGCVIVYPGGGYVMKAYHESEPIALWLNSIGINSFVLDYRVKPYEYPCPLLDAQRAIRWVRANASKYNILEDKIGVLGFSAGGHLAAMAGTRFDYGLKEPLDDVDKVSSRPDVAVLCYPVVSMLEMTKHRENVDLKGTHDEEQLKYMSANINTPKDAPEMFMWHTAQDPVVPVEQSMMMVKALKAVGINSELHIYPDGRHGIGLDEGEDAYRWAYQCEVFLTNRGFANK